MRRRRVKDSRRGLFGRLCDHNSFLIDGSWDQCCSRENESLSSLRIAWVFNPCGVAWIEQSHRADQHRLLHSGHDYDLVRVTMRSSKIAQIGCDCLAQIGVATMGPVSQQGGSLFGENLCSKPFPYCYGKFVDCRMPGN